MGPQKLDKADNKPAKSVVMGVGATNKGESNVAIGVNSKTEMLLLRLQLVLLRQLKPTTRLLLVSRLKETVSGIYLLDDLQEKGLLLQQEKEEILQLAMVH
ncbi:hypothetical protein M8853_08885 [Pasteurella multocida]|nr:hypothetical protein [Pasteurella multocida]URH91645.1 hypothetical protein M8853_08885 [Pasteurella multocida]